MILLFSAVLEIIQKIQEIKLHIQKKETKKVVQKKEKAVLEKDENKSIVNSRVKAKETEEVKVETTKEKKLKVKILILRLLKWILQIIESFITFLVSIIGVTGFFVILAALVLMIAIYGFLHIDFSVINGNIFNNNSKDENCIQGSEVYTSENFDISNISTLMGTFTKGDKQAAEILSIYSEIFNKDLSTVVMSDSKINSVKEKVGVSNLIYFMFGFGAIENDGGLKNIKTNGDSLLEYPSLQKGLYAFLGLNRGNTFNGKYSYSGDRKNDRVVLKDDFVTEWKNKYKPKETPLYENNFMPYGVATQIGVLSTNYLLNKFDFVEQNLDAVMDEYGIQKNRELLKGYIELFATAASYHSGGRYTDSDLLSAWCALWSATSTVDSERSFNKIKIISSNYNYTEPQMRPYIFGSNNFHITWGEQKSGYFEIDGKQVDTVLWDWVSKNCSNPEYFQTTAKVWLDSHQGGDADTVLTDSSYGIAAYIIGRDLSSSLGVVAPIASGGSSQDCIDGSIEKMGINNTIDFENGANTLKNLLAIAMKPVGECMYSWGGGRDSYMFSKGVSPRWKEYYLEWYDKEVNQSIAYNFDAQCPHDSNGDRGTSAATNADGLDCSGFVGWAIVNNREKIGSRVYYTTGASKEGKYLSDLGLGKVIGRNSSDFSYLPGDVYYNSGHTWLCIGPSEYGGCVFVHASPDGVQINGFGGGEKTAAEYMNKYWPNFSVFGKSNYSSQSYAGDYDQFSWNILSTTDTTGKGIKDPDGFRNKTAEEILDYLFNPPSVSGLIGSGLFVNTVGTPQGVWKTKDGQKTTLELISSMTEGQAWGAVPSTSMNSSFITRVKNLVPYMGEAIHASGGNPTCRKSEKAKKVLTETKFKVPYYHQGGDERWGNINSGTNYNSMGGSYFNTNGCHIYSFAYALSATQQRLINPPEALVIGWYGGLWNGGMGGDSNVENLKTYLNLNVKTMPDDKVEGKKAVDDILNKNGVVMVYLTKPFSSGDYHWVVITEKVSENSEEKYKIWTSTKIDQIFQTFTFDELYDKKVGTNWIRMGIMP